ncbi:hypothetical protein C2E23DRAFT_803291 [Lenzites betulinus]|nr:hypothetical protein C2E23DRAFT_803291 [Lenzites betulinus]
MSRNRAVPLLVAGVTGVLSGIYIFKPLFDQNSNTAASHDVPPPVTPTAAAPSGVGTANPGESSPVSVARSHAPVQAASASKTSK